jgi:hypothetical protein
MKPLLPHLLHKVHASNSYWCPTVPTAARSMVSICFHTFKVFHLTHSDIRLMQMQGAEFSSYKLQNISQHATCISQWDEDPISLHPWTILACLFSSKYSDKIKIRRFHNNVWIAVPHTPWDMQHFSLLLSEVSRWYPKGINVWSIFQTRKFASKKKYLCLKTQVLNYGFLVCFVVYHKLLKMVMDELLMHFVNHNMKSNDGRMALFQAQNTC